jgi:hypothetical protein
MLRHCQLLLHVPTSKRSLFRLKTPRTLTSALQGPTQHYTCVENVELFFEDQRRL